MGEIIAAAMVASFLGLLTALTLIERREVRRLARSSFLVALVDNVPESGLRRRPGTSGGAEVAVMAILAGRSDEATARVVVRAIARATSECRNALLDELRRALLHEA